jgi:hypothetical protein
VTGSLRQAQARGFRVPPSTNSGQGIQGSVKMKIRRDEAEEGTKRERESRVEPRKTRGLCSSLCDGIDGKN